MVLTILIHKIFTEIQYPPTATRRLLHLVQLPPAPGCGGLDWDPLRAPGLVRPVRGHVDPAVIEDVRLVFAELIRLGGPKRQKLMTDLWVIIFSGPGN